MSKRLIFFHIPKTAGSSFTSVLKSKFDASSTFYITAGSITTASKYYRVTSDILSSLDSRILENTDLVYGHMPYVDDERLKTFSPITFLREPVKRVVSDYLYTISTNKNPLHHIVKSLTLADYVKQNQDLHLDNLQTRLITGKLTGELTVADVEKAEGNLINKFIFYGLTEYFDYSIVSLNEILGWDISRYPVSNVTKGNHKYIITEADLSAVNTHNEMDILLYERAKVRFVELIKSRQQFFDAQVKKINKIDLKTKSKVGMLFRTIRKSLK